MLRPFAEQNQIEISVMARSNETSKFPT
jgi:hypothetical protein